MKKEIIYHLAEHNIDIEITSELVKIAPEVDVFYQTRLQKERFLPEDFQMYQKYHNQNEFRIDSNLLKLMKPDARILHPLPRVDEILYEVDSDPRAAYFRQVENGLYIREALLVLILADPDIIMNQ